MSEERTGRYVGAGAMVVLMIITGFDFDELTGWMAVWNAAVFAFATFGLVWHVVRLRKLSATDRSLPRTHPNRSITSGR